MKTRVLLFVLITLLTGQMIIHGQPLDEVLKVVAQNNNGLSDRDLKDHFGSSVAISGNYAIIGATGEDMDPSGGNPKNDAGAAYIYKRQGGVWVFEQKIVAPDRGEGDHFGSVAISGNYAVVGAVGEDHDVQGSSFKKDAGAAYIYKRQGANWIFDQKIVASDRESGDYFGGGVAISGSYIIVGAGWKGPQSQPYNFGAGGAYIFERSGSPGGWSETQIIEASDRAAGDLFGPVSISGNYAIVGAFREDDGANNIPLSNAGAAYIFERNPNLLPGTQNAWVEAQKIDAPNREANDYFGYSVAISGNYAVVGAYAEDDNSGGTPMLFAGAAYIFERDPGPPFGTSSWECTQTVVAPTRAPGEHFGHDVAVDENYIVVGAYRYDAMSGHIHHNSGAAHILKRNATPPTTPGAWTEIGRIESSDTALGDNFGNSVAISGCSAIIGAWTEDEDAGGLNTINRAGSAYFFECKGPSCDIPNVEVSLRQLRLTGKFDLNINSNGTLIEKVEVSMDNFQVTYINDLCKTASPGVIGNIVSSTGNFTGLILTNNNSQAVSWVQGSPAVLNGKIRMVVSKPGVLDLPCCDGTFEFCLKVKLTDINGNVCEKTFCRSLELKSPTQFPGDFDPTPF